MSKGEEGPFLVKLMSGEWVMAMIRRDTVSPSTLYLSYVLQIVERGPKVEFKQWCPLAPLDSVFVINEFGVLTYLTPAQPLAESYNKMVGLVSRPTTPASSERKARGRSSTDGESAGHKGKSDKIIPLIPD